MWKNVTVRANVAMARLFSPHDGNFYIDPASMRRRKIEKFLILTIYYDFSSQQENFWQKTDIANTITNVSDNALSCLYSCPLATFHTSSTSLKYQNINRRSEWCHRSETEAMRPDPREIAMPKSPSQPPVDYRLPSQNVISLFANPALTCIYRHLKLPGKKL